MPAKEFVIDDVIKLEKADIPVYSTPEQAVEVLAAMYHYKKYGKNMETQLHHIMHDSKIRQ